VETKAARRKTERRVKKSTKKPVKYYRDDPKRALRAVKLVDWTHYKTQSNDGSIVFQCDDPNQSMLSHETLEKLIALLRPQSFHWTVKSDFRVRITKRAEKKHGSRSSMMVNARLEFFFK
jgi:hypothetical protein